MLLKDFCNDPKYDLRQLSVLPKCYFASVSYKIHRLALSTNQILKFSILIKERHNQITNFMTPISLVLRYAITINQFLVLKMFVIKASYLPLIGQKLTFGFPSIPELTRKTEANFLDNHPQNALKLVRFLVLFPLPISEKQLDYYHQ